MKFFMTCAAVTLLSTTAFAADRDFPYETVSAPTSQVAAPYTWTGAYIGLNAGYSGGTLKSKSDVPAENDTTAVTGSGFIGGSQAGFNWQVGSFVYGAETDFQFSQISAGQSGQVEGAPFEVETRVKWLGTTRARLGFLPTERLMTYATGGVAYGKMEVNSKGTSDGEAFKESASKALVGWVVGAGAEYAIDNKWSLKTEYLYTDLGKMPLDDPDFGRTDLNFKFHTVRAGLNYKF